MRTGIITTAGGGSGSGRRDSRPAAVSKRIGSDSPRARLDVS
jgi:hypothetical protein